MTTDVGARGRDPAATAPASVAFSEETRRVAGVEDVPREAHADQRESSASRPTATLADHLADQPPGPPQAHSTEAARNTTSASALARGDRVARVPGQGHGPQRSARRQEQTDADVALPQPARLVAGGDPQREAREEGGPGRRLVEEPVLDAEEGVPDPALRPAVGRIVEGERARDTGLEILEEAHVDRDGQVPAVAVRRRLVDGRDLYLDPLGRPRVLGDRGEARPRRPSGGRPAGSEPRDG